MIKAEVTLVGTVRQAAQVKQNTQGAYYYSSSVSTSVPKQEGGFQEVFVSIRAPHGASAGLEQLMPNQHVSLKGTLSFRKDGDNIYYNMAVTECAAVDPILTDGIVGELSMIGVLGSKAPEVKNGKNGKPFMNFSAYSGDGEGDDRVYTWVRFTRFSDIVEPFLVPKALVEAKGALELQYYQNKLSIKCRLAEVKPYVKKGASGIEPPQAPEDAPF